MLFIFFRNSTQGPRLFFLSHTIPKIILTPSYLVTEITLESSLTVNEETASLYLRFWKKKIKTTVIFPLEQIFSKLLSNVNYPFFICRVYSRLSNLFHGVGHMYQSFQGKWLILLYQCWLPSHCIHFVYETDKTKTVSQLFPTVLHVNNCP